MRRRILPIDAVMTGERPGGWGRSMSGLQRTIKRLSACAATQARAVELRAYLDVVEKARKLQPSRLHELDGPELAQIVDTLVRGRATFPPNVEEALCAREIAHRAETAEAMLNSDEAWEAFIRATVPWSTASATAGQAPPQRFDPKRPRLRDVGGSTTARVARFNELVISGWLVPQILLGLPAQAKLENFAMAMGDALAEVDVLHLEDADAQAWADTKVVCALLKAITGSDADMVEGADQLESMMQVSTKRLDTIGMVCAALRVCPHYKEKYERHLADGAALREVLPLIETHTRECEGADALMKACQVITTYASAFTSLPSAYDRFKAFVASKIRAVVPELISKLSTSSISDDLKVEIHAAQKLLCEASLAYPMEPWVSELQLELADAVGKLNTRVFEQEFIFAVGRLAENMGFQSDPPATFCVDAVAKLVSRAAVGVHFTSVEARAAVDKCLAAYAIVCQESCAPAWSHVGDVAGALAPYASTPVEWKARCRVLSSLIGLAAATRDARGDAAQLPTGWRERAGELARALELAQKAVSALKPPPLAGSIETASDGQVTELHYIDARMAAFSLAASTLLDELHALAVRALNAEKGPLLATLSKIGRGDHDGTGTWWCPDESQEMTLDELNVVALQTIFKFKPSEVNESIKSAVEYIQRVLDITSLFGGRATVETDDIQHNLNKVHEMKATAVIMRLVAKHVTNNEDKRAQIRAELLATRRLLPTFDTHALPLPLRVEVNKIISCSRR